MGYKIEGNEAVTVGNTAVNVAVGYRDFLLHNNSEQKVCFHAKETDGKDVSIQTGMMLLPGETMKVVLSCQTLSLIATSAGADVRILYLSCG